jgi:hypothetical protein
VVEKAEYDVLTTCEIRLAGQVQRPCPVSPRGGRNTMLERASKYNDVVRGLAQDISHIGFADRNPAVGELPVEDFGNDAASSIGDQAFSRISSLRTQSGLGWHQAGAWHGMPLTREWPYG